MANLKQFNFKIPQELYEQLSAAANARGVKMTELVIQGIQQVLGIASTSSRFGVDLDIYQFVDETKVRLDELADETKVRLDRLEQDHADIAKKLYQYIPKLENELNQLKNSIPILDIGESIVSDIYMRVLRDLEKREVIGSLETEEAHLQLTQPKKEGDGKSIESTRAIQDVAINIDNTEMVAGIQKELSAERTQLEITGLEDKKKNPPAGIRKIDSTEMLKLLKQVDSDKNWSSQLLTSHRRLKRYLNKWYEVGDYQFKYAGEDKESGKTKHLWWIAQINIAKDSKP